MARRRKKTRALAKATPANGGPAVLDKSLPALPAQTSPRRPKSPEIDSVASDTPQNLSPISRPARSHKTGSNRKDITGDGMDEQQGMKWIS